MNVNATAIGQNKTRKIGVLLTNSGTPDAPTPQAVRRYLREFLSDKRIIQLPRIVWLPILYGLVLTIRPRRSASYYQAIWTKDGSPMRLMMQKMRLQLQHKLNENSSAAIYVEVGMNYGNPSINDSLEKLRSKNIDKLIVLPLYPQYSYTTSAASFDKVKKAINKHAPAEVNFIQGYADNNEYIRALACSLLKRWAKHGIPEHLLISFHGIPERYCKTGDPYQIQCELTARLLADELKLPKDKWTLCYQSRFGYNKWLEPCTQHLLEQLPQRSINNIEVICPGFSVDCLETLEEICLRGKEMFLQAGGESLHYIPALNDDTLHIDMLTNIIHSQFGKEPT